MRVCVTGGTGFLGSYLVRDLLARGTNIRVLARPSARADRLAAAGVEIVQGDLRDPDSIARAVKDADIVYHLPRSEPLRIRIISRSTSTVPNIF
jgi:uncharacterized protein YbjT (DUF2867 family)